MSPAALDPAVISIEARHSDGSMAECDRLGSFDLRQTLRRDLFTVDRYIAGGFNSNPNLIAVDLYNRDNDIVTDDDLLTQLPAKNQHGDLPVDLSFELCFCSPI
jgi:hypothetical protein